MSATPAHEDPTRSAGMRAARSAAKVTAAGATVAFVLAGTAVPAAHAQSKGDCSTTLNKVTCIYDNPLVSYVLRVPAGVSEVHVDARGAAGGDGGTVNAKVPAPQGGTGGMVTAAFPVVAGDLVRVLVGGHGGDANGIRAGAGGRNGGAQGGAGAAGGGGGGGASQVFVNGRDPASRILAAGGGGGAGGAMTSTAVSSARGGDGGGDRGADGQGDNFGQGGIGAVGPSGGAGLETLLGLDGHSGYDADLGGGGGEGGYGTSSAIKHSGTWAGGPVAAGGGGGGYGGGSGGAAGATVGGGGGGGSGFAATSALAPTQATLGSVELLMGKGSVDDGVVVITYRLPLDRHGRSAPSAAGATSTTEPGKQH